MISSASRAFATVSLALLSLLLVTGSASSAEGATLRTVDSPRETPASVTGGGLLAKYSNEAADVFIVPFFKVDRSNAQGETTLIAVRNATDDAHDVRISYFVDRIFPSSPDLVQTFSLIPDEVRTFNLRDLPQISGGQGGDAVVRGWILVEHADGHGDSFSADWFRVNPAEDFATGDRMVDVDHSGTCTQWDFRYLIGGSFDGGTRLELFIDTPLGGNPATHSPSATLEFYSESGTFLGALELFTNRQVEEIDVAAELADLPGSPASFGSMVITFEPGTNGGLVAGTYRAESRYSVGLTGTCIVP